MIEALGVLEPRGSPVPWHDGSLSDLSLTGEEPVPSGSPSGSGSALSAQSTEALEGLNGRGPKAGGRQEEAGTPRRSLGARLQQLLTPSRRAPASRIPPPELPTDLPPPARRSPMDSLLRPRERPGSTASEVGGSDCLSMGRWQGGGGRTWVGGMGWWQGLPTGSKSKKDALSRRGVGLESAFQAERRDEGLLTTLSCAMAELGLSGQRVGPLRIFSQQPEPPPLLRTPQ